MTLIGLFSGGALSVETGGQVKLSDGSKFKEDLWILEKNVDFEK